MFRIIELGRITTIASSIQIKAIEILTGFSFYPSNRSK